MTPLLSRIMTAVVLMAMFVPAVLWAPAWLWAILMAVVVGMAAYEWARLSQFPPLSARIYAVLLTLCALALPYRAGGGLADFPGGADRAGHRVLAARRTTVVAGALAGYLGICARGGRRGACCCRPGLRCCICMHVAPAFLLGVMAVVWIADTAAYFAGRRFGRHKLAPSHQPRQDLGRRGWRVLCAGFVCKRLESAGWHAIVVAGHHGVRLAVSVGAG